MHLLEITIVLASIVFLFRGFLIFYALKKNYRNIIREEGERGTIYEMKRRAYIKIWLSSISLIVVFLMEL